jgi:hypothetical protein
MEEKSASAVVFFHSLSFGVGLCLVVSHQQIGKLLLVYDRHRPACLKEMMGSPKAEHIYFSFTAGQRQRDVSYQRWASQASPHFLWTRHEKSSASKGNVRLGPPSVTVTYTTPRMAFAHSKLYQPCGAKVSDGVWENETLGKSFLFHMWISPFIFNTITLLPTNLLFFSIVRRRFHGKESSPLEAIRELG